MKRKLLHPPHGWRKLIHTFKPTIPPSIGKIYIYICIPKPWNLGYFNSLISTKFTKEFWHQTRFSDPQFESCIMASHKSLYFARQSFPDSIDSDVAENTCRLPQASTTRPELKSEGRTVLHRSRWSHHSDDHTIWQGQIVRRLRRMFFWKW